MSLNGGPAFPLPITSGESGYMDTEEYCKSNVGMSLRDWFAGQIAAAEVASAGANEDAAMALLKAARGLGMTIEQRIAQNAYSVADALLEAREISQ